MRLPQWLHGAVTADGGEVRPCSRRFGFCRSLFRGRAPWQIALSKIPRGPCREMPDCCRAGSLLSSGTGVGRMRGGPSNGLEDCSSEFRHRRGRPERPEELAYHRTILFSGLSTTTDWRFEEDGRELRVRIGPSLATNSGEVAIEHARAGGGLPCALGYQVRDLVRSGELEIVLS